MLLLFVPSRGRIQDAASCSPGDLVEGARILEGVLPGWRESESLPGLAQALTDLGGIVLDLGDARRSRALLEEALLVWKRIGNRWGSAWALYSLGRLRHAEHDHSAALALFNQSLEQRIEIGDRHGRAESLEAIALIETDRGKWKEASDHLAEAGSLRREADTPIRPRRRAEIEYAAGVLRSRLGSDSFTYIPFI